MRLFICERFVFLHYRYPVHEKSEENIERRRRDWVFLSLFQELVFMAIHHPSQYPTWYSILSPSWQEPKNRVGLNFPWVINIMLLQCILIVNLFLRWARNFHVKVKCVNNLKENFLSFHYENSLVLPEKKTLLDVQLTWETNSKVAEQPTKYYLLSQKLRDNHSHSFENTFH